MARSAQKAAPKKAAVARAKFAPGQCHHRSADGQPDCKRRIEMKGANLCGTAEKAGHQQAWAKAARERAAAKPKAAKAPKSAGTSPDASKARDRRLAKANGGQLRTVKPPVPEMHAAAIPVVKANVAEPALVMLVAHE